MISKHQVVVCALGALTAVLLGSPVAQAEHHEGQTIVVHLSHFGNDLHAVNMALKLGTVMQQGGHKVTLFVDLEGVRLADKGQPLSLRWGETKPIAELYADFIDAGGKVLVCPHCAAAAGIEATNLRQGATMGTSESIAKLLASADKILDY